MKEHRQREREQKVKFLINFLSVSFAAVVTLHKHTYGIFALLRMPHTIHLIYFLTFLFFVNAYSERLRTVGHCLSDLITHEHSNSYNYLQLSSKFGTKDAYPGFSSLFIKLSDDDASKAHDITKFLALRQIQLDRLINLNGIKIHPDIKTALTVHDRLKQAIHHNRETLTIIQRCHQDAANARDANIQDYLESHVLDHHVKVDKLLSDFQHRITDPQESDKELTIFMLDEELLHTYGDRRKDIF